MDRSRDKKLRGEERIREEDWNLPVAALMEPSLLAV